MKSFAWLGALVVALPLAGCAPDDASTDSDTPLASVPAPAHDTCGANRYAELIGQTSPTITIPEGQVYRMLREGQPATMDYIQERLTFVTDRQGKLLSVTCG